MKILIYPTSFRKKIPVVTCLFLVTIIYSCKKESNLIQDTNHLTTNAVIKVKNGRLNFSSIEAFGDEIQQLKNTNLNNSKDYSIGNVNSQNFISLYSLKEKNITSSYSRMDAKIESDTLVPDPYFSRLLNDKKEIEVAGTIYKVTTYGTYIFKPEKENRVYNILDSLRRVKYKLSNQNRKIPGEVKKGQYLYFVESGIYRFDTFKNEHTEEAKKNTQYYYARETTDDPLPQSIYDQFITFGYDSHTFAGQTLQGIFGRNKSHYNKFDRKHRVKVKLYNLNYFVYASVGIKVKMHKRGWTGIWHTVKANEIRLGWDGLIVDIEIPYAPALPHSMQINANTTKLGTITFLSKNFSIAGVSINNDLVNKALNGALKSGFKSAVGTIWDYVRKSVAPSQYETEENEVRAFRAIYPNKARIVFDRYEESKKNVKKIVEVFDTNVGIKFTWDGSGLPNPSPNTYKYTLVGGSVYGAAKYNGTWKGVRVKKY